MLVKDIMSKVTLTVSPEDTVQKFISMMERHHVHEALVLKNKKLVGEVNYKTLAKKNILDPTKTKIRKIMNKSCPKASPEDSVNRIASLLFETGVRAVPVIEKGFVKGIVSSHDVIDAAAKTKLFRQTAVESIMTEPILITEDTEIGRVRAMMREKNISRLPIVDKNDKIKGIVAAFDLLKAVKPRERMGWYSMAAEMDKIMRIPVSTIMNTSPATAGPKKSLSEIASLMTRKKTSGIVITEDRFPKGIVTIKDLLEVFVSQQKKEGIYYQIIGLADEDDFIVSTINRMIRGKVQKMSRIYKPDFFFLHVKRYETGLKSKVKYSVRARIRTNKGVFMSKSWAWDLRTAVDETLDNLEKIILKERNTLRSRIKSGLMKRKRSSR